MYLRSKLPVKGKWPPAPCKKIIKLATIEIEEDHSQLASCKLNRSESIDEYMKKNSMNPISMEDLLAEKDGSLPKAVIIQGVPGIGIDDNKTLLTLSLPAECEPIEYGSILMDDIRKSGRIEFVNKKGLV